jgi:hypothetical protein
MNTKNLNGLTDVRHILTDARGKLEEARARRRHAVAYTIVCLGIVGALCATMFTPQNAHAARSHHSSVRSHH